VLEQVRAAAPRLLAAVLPLATTALEARPPRLPKRVLTVPSGRVAMAGVRARCSPGWAVTLARPWYVCAACARGWSPADRTLDLDRTRGSVGEQAWLADFAAGQTFRETVGLLRELTWLAGSPETVRRLTEQRGTAQADVQSATAAAIQARRARWSRSIFRSAI
jgi:hypothetical protein